MDSIGVESWSLLIKTSGKVLADGGDAVDTKGDLSLQSTVGGLGYRDAWYFRNVVGDRVKVRGDYSLIDLVRVPHDVCLNPEMADSFRPV